MLNASMPSLGRDVIARYGNWFHQDDDFFTHVLILKNGQCWRLGQGLNAVKLHTFKANAAKFRQLKTALNSIPASWPDASYDNAGYNFITDAEGPTASEVAVFGKKPGINIGAYYVPPAGSTVETLVKAIANID
jgi:hypothetical protein